MTQHPGSGKPHTDEPVGGEPRLQTPAPAPPGAAGAAAEVEGAGPSLGGAHTPAVDPRQAFLAAVTHALRDYEVATTGGHVVPLAAADEDEPPHVTQLPPRPDHDAPHGQHLAHKLAVLAFAARIVAALPAGSDPSIRVSSYDSQLTIQAAARDFDHATAARIAASLGLDGHSSHPGKGGLVFHTWFHGERHDSPLELVWSGPAGTAVAE
ncbi:MAG TPA: hypothetical protein VFM55_19040 [Micromonosporaceae bacterium]|nr:hypothetical protein [Micromonosporaceae bacterium]